MSKLQISIFILMIVFGQNSRAGGALFLQGFVPNRAEIKHTDLQSDTRFHIESNSKFKYQIKRSIVRGSSSLFQKISIEAP